MCDASVSTNGPLYSHKTFKFDDVTISSDFDSGNMLRAERKATTHFWIWTANDWMYTERQTCLRSWFHFSVTTGSSQGANYTFSMRNLNNHLKMFREGMKPVVKIGNGGWDHIEGRYTYLCSDNNMELTFNQSFDKDETYYFAFWFPWSYTENC